MGLKEEIEEYLEKFHNDIKALDEKVLNVWYEKDGIKVFVEAKDEVERKEIEDRLPKFHGKYPIYVVRLEHEGWIAKVNRLSPKQQVRTLGLAPKEEKYNLNVGQDFEKDWRNSGKLIAVRNQQSCGSCTAFSVTNTWSDNISILKNEQVILSPQHIFFCSGGTCENGNTMDNTLNFGVNNGVALEKDCLYVSAGGVDEACGYGLSPTWYLRGKMLQSYKSITNISDMKNALMISPLATTMNVHQSFMNYAGGIYHSGGVNDKIVGGHAIETVGGSDSGKYWICKNQWGLNWGENGYFRIAYGDSGIDNEMYSVVLSDKHPVGELNECILDFDNMKEDLLNSNYSGVITNLVAGIGCLIKNNIINISDIIKSFK